MYLAGGFGQAPISATEVLIIGAGPIGLTLALDLALRGIAVMLVDCKADLLRLPKVERSNPWSMEIFRRLGVVEQIRAAGDPADLPMDVSIVTSMGEVYPGSRAFEPAGL